MLHEIVLYVQRSETHSEHLASHDSQYIDITRDLLIYPYSF